MDVKTVKHIENVCGGDQLMTEENYEDKSNNIKVYFLMKETLNNFLLC